MSLVNTKSIAFLIVVCMISLNCSKNSVINPENNKYEFSWQVDTIKSPNGFISAGRKIWGSSPKDVWIIGFNNSYAGEIYHYDGKSWARMTPDFQLNADYEDMIGFSSQDIYFAGYTFTGAFNTKFHSLIIHYDGKNFHQEEIPESEGVLSHIWGRSRNDIWACGFKGLLYHFDGVKWNLIKQNPGIDLGPIFGTGTEDVFMISRTNDYKKIDSLNGASTLYFSSLESNTWKIKDSCKIHSERGEMYGFTFGYNAMWGTSKTDLYSIADKIYKYNGSKWNLTGWTYNEVEDIRGTGVNDIYVVGLHGFIVHYDGNEWKTIEKYTDTIADFYSVQPFDNEIFILVFYLGKAYVVRGVKESSHIAT